jgi:hypothetical protein
MSVVQDRLTRALACQRRIEVELNRQRQKAAGLVVDDLLAADADYEQLCKARDEIGDRRHHHRVALSRKRHSIKCHLREISLVEKDIVVCLQQDDSMSAEITAIERKLLARRQQMLAVAGQQLALVLRSDNGPQTTTV